MKKEELREVKNMSVYYSSTRNGAEKLTASQAILKGLADDGGLFVPDKLPKLDVSLDKLKDMSYQETAYEVMKLLLTDFTEEELKNCINKAYDSKFDTEEIAPLVEADGAYYLELFHGSTIAFKDMALSILPHLLITSAKKNNIKNDIVILTATSGDTGKAALAGFSGVEGTKIIVFYPKNGVSPIQEKQMVTQKGDNTCVIGINGNFDQAQTGVKKMFADEALKKELEEKGYQFSSANSINIGRLVPQIVYYVYSYAKLYANNVIKKDKKINVVVPTGNFGNILAAYYAKNMGIPIAKLICASNENKVLFDFFKSGKYDKNREFILTNSPSMDILISSNLERLIYRIAGNNTEANSKFMSDLRTKGSYEITDGMREELKDFYGNYTSEEETAEVIKKLYEDTGYVIDTHTAVAAGVFEKYKKETNDTETKTVIASTASPFKFTRSVMEAIDKDKYESLTDFELVDELSKIANVRVPNAIEEIRNAEILHDKVCDVDQMPEFVKDFLK
jgi:threonine synthase